ncbi:MAG: hydantoinase B/oxoprolinase family protein [Dehalococcoidia bacterium]
MTVSTSSARTLVQQEFDPFTIEIIDSAIQAIVDEMMITTQRTSQSVIIYEALDFAVGFTDADGNLVSQGNGVTLFLGTLRAAVQSVIRKFDADINRGDIFVTNDPYEGGGTHLCDVTVVRPIIADGVLIAFACNKAHWTELGGKQPGSVATDTTEIYQEGVQLPCVRAFERDEPNHALRDTIRANVRLPDMTEGDLQAQAASVRLAESRFLELCSKYGNAAVSVAMARRMSQSSELARRELLGFPEGAYSVEDWLDEDGMGGGPYKLAVEVTVADGRMTCDFTGTAPQLSSPLNLSRAGLEAGVNAAFLGILGPGVPVSEGVFDHLEIVCPPRTVFTAERPAPISVYWEVAVRVIDLVWHAFAAIAPDRVTAGHFTTVAADLIAGPHPKTGELFILFEPNAGGWGAGAGKDGERALVSIGDGETFCLPVEIIEQRYGVRVEQYAFDVREGAAGAGQWRGGQGIVKDYRILAREATVTSFIGRHKYPPWGAQGGSDGSTNALEVHGRDGGFVSVGMHAQFPVAEGDLVRLRTATGGGWGDPLLRDPQAIAADVRDGFLSHREATEIFGVVLNEAGAPVSVTKARADRQGLDE